LRRTGQQTHNGEISVREFVRDLASSVPIVGDSTRHPNTKVIEFLFHILGRAPATQGEIRQYNKLLADGGLKAV